MMLYTFPSSQSAGTGGTVTTPASTPKTVGQVTGISIAATPNTGYTFNSWSSTEGLLEMTLDATNNTYTYTGTFDAGVGIKVIKVEGQTTTWYPEGMDNEYTINIAGEHTIVFNPQTGEYTVSDDEATPVETVADGYYLVGSFSDWKAKADYAFAENAGAAGEYMLTTTDGRFPNRRMVPLISVRQLLLQYTFWRR